jgi:hypothetical protein
MRVLVASAEQLAALARENRLLVDSAQAPFDEALRHLEGRLGRAVGEN